MTIKDLTLFLVIASLIATYLNIKKKRVCFKIWLVTNTLWASYDFWIGAFWQGWLFVTYVGLAIYGIWSWRKGKDET